MSCGGCPPLPLSVSFLSGKLRDDAVVWAAVPSPRNLSSNSTSLSILSSFSLCWLCSSMFSTVFFFTDGRCDCCKVVVLCARGRGRRDTAPLPQQLCPPLLPPSMARRAVEGSVVAAARAYSGSSFTFASPEWAVSVRWRSGALLFASFTGEATCRVSVLSAFL